MQATMIHLVAGDGSAISIPYRHTLILVLSRCRHQHGGVHVRQNNTKQRIITEEHGLIETRVTISMCRSHVEIVIPTPLTSVSAREFPVAHFIPARQYEHIR